tara:strand:+ start:214 stop:912 length:699 start_codon:yes stop_codon:yes gene_type:complete
MTIGKKVIVAIDSNNIQKACLLIDTIKDHIFGVKIGYEFFLNFGLFGYNKIYNKNINIFLDLKLHDIPNTVEKGIKAIALLKPYFTTVHISGGDKMLKITNLKKKKTKILGVSALTSFDNKQAKKYYSRQNINRLVADFTKCAIENKLDGIICSPLEIEMVKKIAGKKLIIVTPGIRPLNYKKKDDQKRIMSPGEAISLGANYLVIGRPITKSKNPAKQIIEINSEIAKYKN